MIPVRYLLPVRRSVAGAPDPHGNPATVWESGTVKAHSVEPGPTAEEIRAGRKLSDVDWTVYAVAGTSLGAADEVQWLGRWYGVVGASKDWTHGPWDTPVAGVVVELKAQDG